MKVLVTGREGQLVLSLLERARRHPDIELIALGRPDLDLAVPGSADQAIRGTRPGVVVNAAAYTAVDQAEDEPDLAFRINGAGAGEVAAAARAVGALTVQISTDYVFDGAGEGAYDESAPTAPLGVYGRSKLDGEDRVRDADPDAVIVRTAWVYSPFGRNFVRTMLKLGETRPELGVVADQHGNPSSALDLANGLLAMVTSWRTRGAHGTGRTYHLAGTGEASWHEFASEIFTAAEANGAPRPVLRPLTTAEFPTKAARPKNSRLDCTRFAREFGYAAPEWRQSTRSVVARLLDAERHS